MLRYGCQLDTAHPEEKDRKFILFYNLSDGAIKIIELAIPNSGIMGGKFLNSRLLPKPESNPNRPDYYTPKDLFIGALVKVFATRFVITSADLYVYRYMQAHPELFLPEVIDNVRLYHLKEGNLREDLQKAIQDDHEKYLLELKTKESISSAITNAIMEKPIEEPITGERIPRPYTGEEEVKRDYHEKVGKACLPCNIDVKQEENIPSDKGIVRFLEPHEEIGQNN
jgi:EF-hand domain-containing protein 1